MKIITTIIISSLFMFCIQTNAETPIKTYRKALKQLFISKEYKEFIKQRIGRKTKKNDYVIMTKIYPFYEDVFMFRDIPKGLVDSISFEDDGYEDTNLRKLNRSKKGNIIIRFTMIYKKYFTIAVFVSSRKLSNPQSADLWFAGLYKLFLFKQTEFGIQIIKTTEAYAG